MTNNSNGVQYDDASHATATLDGANGTQVKNVADGVDAQDAVNKGQMDAGDAATLAAANAYADAGDAATLTAANTHADAGDAATLTESKTYTDTKTTQTLQSANAYTDSKFAAWNDSFTQFQQQTQNRLDQMDRRMVNMDRRIDQIGAMSGAMSAAALNTAGLPGRNRVGIGAGAQNGRTAVAISYQRLVAPNASVSIGSAISGSDSSVSAGAGFSW